MTDEQKKQLDDIIGSHLPADYRERLQDFISELVQQTYDAAWSNGYKWGTQSPGTS